MPTSPRRSVQDDVTALGPTGERYKQLLGELEAIREAFLAESPLRDIPPQLQQLDDAEWAQPRKHLASYVEGQRYPLTTLEERLTAAFYADDIPKRFDVKIVICDIATRKYYGPKQGKDEVDLAPYEDVSRGPFWFWELRSMNQLPETLKQKASLDRMKHKQMQERFLALSTVIRLTENAQKANWTAAGYSRVMKAIEKMERVSNLNAINDGFSEVPDDDAYKQAMPRYLSISNGTCYQQVGKRVRREVSMSSSLSTERKKKKQNRSETPAGFGSVKSFKMSQKLFKSFFEASPTSPTQPEEELVFRMAGRCVLSCPANKRLAFLMGDVGLIDAQLSGNPNAEQVKQEFLSWTQGIRSRPNRFKSVIYGAPPTWARRPGHVFSFEAEAEKLFGSEWKKLEICTVRMKYLWFSSDSDCPPYYGPFASIDGVRPRNPFAQVPGLDYDELFDEGWEPEPEGESLSADEDDEDDKYLLSDDDAAFVVADGHLSEDEGHGAEMETDETGSNASADDEDETQELVTNANLSQIEVKVCQSVRSGKPMIITRLPITIRPSRDWIKGDPALLNELKMVCLTEEKIRVGKRP